MNSAALLDAVKNHHRIDSDRALARILKISQASVNSWRTIGLPDERVVQFATLIGTDPGPCLTAVHAERSKDPAVRKAWETIAKTIRSAAAAVLVLLGMGITAPEPLQASQHFPRYTLCEVRRLRRAWAAMLGILSCFGLGAAPVYASDWTKDDTGWQVAYLALHVADWGQTRNIVHRADTGCAGDPTCIERNPFIGRNPSIRRVDTYFAFTALTHTAISYALPPDWRRGWQMITIGMEAGVVGYNYSIGLKMDF